MFEYENDHFKVYETFCDFRIMSKVSGKSASMGDMVGVYDYEDGNTVTDIMVGTPQFYSLLLEDLKRHGANFWMEVYFPEDYAVIDLRDELSFLRDDTQTEDTVNRILELEDQLHELVSEGVA